VNLFRHLIKSKKWARLPNSKLFIFICIAIFLALRIHSISKTHPPVVNKINKPLLPPPITVTQAHPWLQLQPSVQGAALEIVRDLEKIRHLAASLPNLSEKEMTLLLIKKLLALQTAIPFTFPDSLYNVLCITEGGPARLSHKFSEQIAPLSAEITPQRGEGSVQATRPHPAGGEDRQAECASCQRICEKGGLATFHVHKRLYLGETELGLPFYLDVRVFELDTNQSEEIIVWHLTLLDGRKEELLTTKERKAFLCYGRRNASYADTTHGFAALQEERALFLDFYEKENRLYVCYAEAPLTTFNQHATLFRSLAAK
jgi:hypothetical protein